MSNLPVFQEKGQQNLQKCGKWHFKSHNNVCKWFLRARRLMVLKCYSYSSYSVPIKVTLISLVSVEAYLPTPHTVDMQGLESN